ncbi:MAG: DUF308 domain-containing protein [Bacilli bacterium]|nr:DUF308 domain-containing protein [Bacilli bacterium]
MNKESRITVNNLIYALLFLVFGIILLTSTEDLITIISKVIGGVLIVIGIIKAIIYIYMKGKLGEYSLSKLIVSLSFISFGMLLIFLSGTLSFAIRTVIGIWVVFSGINRVIFAISMCAIDKKSFLVYLITSLLMITLGIVIITGVFDKLIGLLIIVYSVIEIVNYIYFKVKNKDFEEIIEKPVKKEKKLKRLKKGKVVDAIIEEGK